MKNGQITTLKMIWLDDLDLSIELRNFIDDLPTGKRNVFISPPNGRVSLINTWMFGFILDQDEVPENLIKSLKKLIKELEKEKIDYVRLCSKYDEESTIMNPNCKPHSGKRRLAGSKRISAGEQLSTAALLPKKNTI